jgi:hypothetical protein
MKAQRDAAILQLGLNPETAELDHRPPLALRYRDAETGRYEPAANDPRYLRWLAPEPHATATFKNNGTGRGDLTAIAHVKRTVRKQAEHQARVVAKVTGEPAPQRRKQKIPSRGFDKRQRQPLRSRNTFQRRRT